MKMLKKAGIVVALLAATQVANAATYSFNNGDFETGDLTGWTLTGTGGVDSVNQYEGDYAGYISGGSTLQQTAFINAGDTVSFMWRFIAGDYLPFNDLAFYVGGTYQKLADVAAVGNYGDSGWRYFSWVADDTYVGPVIFGIANVGDSLLDSKLLLDAPVPLPGAALLFGSALLGAGALGRKKLAGKQAQALAA
jgi:hypothetical protein